MKKIIALLLVLLMMFSLAACGGTEEDPNAGVYQAVSATALGMTLAIEDVYPEGGFIELKSGGKGTVSLGADQFNVKWSLEGEELTVSVAGEPSVGSLKDGTISIDFMDMGLLLVFQKEGTAAVEIPVESNVEQIVEEALNDMTAAEEAAEPVEESAVISEIGKWKLLRVDSDVEEDRISEEDLALFEASGMAITIEFNEDGTGFFNLAGEGLEITWSDGVANMGGEDASYSIEDGKLLLNQPNICFVFVKAE